jgi:hypothetical protein
MKNRKAAVKKAGPKESRQRAMYMVLKVDESGQSEQVQVMGYKQNTQVKKFVQEKYPQIISEAEPVSLGGR